VVPYETRLVARATAPYDCRSRMSITVVGRDAELASIRDFVATISDGATALVLEGEAGVGKTTLWAAGIEQAQEWGLRVLQARPAESETALSFSGVGDLLDRVLEEALSPLAVGQKRALSRALLLEDDHGTPPDPHAVGVAVLNAVRALADTRPTLIAVDDVQWLDAASSGAFAYAARRLQGERVGVLLARRTPLESGLSSELRRSLPSDRITELIVGPLDTGALHRIVHSHLDTVLPRPLLAEVHEASGGNPFYALEIVRTLQRSGISTEAGQPLRVPDSLHALVHGRLLALPADCRTFLLAAAAHAHPTVVLTEEASGVGRAAGLAPALEALVVELEGDRIRFTHPLLAAGAYATAAPARRAEIHSRLAELLTDPEARAWQLAASVAEPDEEVALALEDAARHARARGAPRPAALLLDRARELTPGGDSDDALRRGVEAAYLHYESGDSPRAEAQLREVMAKLAPGRSRARALVRLARVRAYDSLLQAAELFLQAVDEAEGDPEILGAAHQGVADCLWYRYERLDEAIDHAGLAAELALEVGDEGLAVEALTTRWSAELLLGRETAPAAATRALALQPVVEDRRLLMQPRFVFAADYLRLTGAYEEARTEVVEMLRRSSERGDESSAPLALAYLAHIECELGELESALAHALEGQDASEQAGQHTSHAFNVALESLVEARRGREERARAAALRALDLVPETGGLRAELVATSALGHLELVLGDPDATVARLEPLVAFVRRETVLEPAATPFVIDHIEALVEVGRREEGVELLDWYEENARRLERVSALAACMRCRGLLAAAEGRLEDALVAYEDALEWHGRVELPLDRGRTLLALGAAQRRAKRRREARGTLEEALAVFERIGAALWAERARAELRRISGRAPSPGALTPAEERVAALVADGKTNREVATALFLSERTVEGHLSRVFGKLGIKHRTEVARALLARQTPGGATPNTRDSPVSAGPVAP
jgi:DNA-binding CsgD family transcriptional regulator